MIETHGLRKSYRLRRRGHDSTVDAVRGVELTVHQGEVFGFMGPNGAGKTTTVRMLATLLAPDGGTATVAGYSLTRDPGRIRRHIGYVSQAGGVAPATTPRQNVLLQARLFALPARQARRRADELLDRFGLTGVLDRPAGLLSGGQQRRLALVVGLVHQPRLLFLDEPTLGLDPLARAELWAEIRDLRAGGTTVFLTTHYLDEADALCDRVAIIDQGRIVAAGPQAQLKRAVSTDVVQVRLAGRAGPVAVEKLAAVPLVRSVRADEDALRVYADDGERALPTVLRVLDETGGRAESVTLSRASLDDVFLHHTGRVMADGNTTEEETDETLRP